MSNYSKRSLPQLLLVFILPVVFSVQSYSQGKADLTLGIGLPEMLNAGVLLQGKNSQFGLSIGSLPVREEGLFTLNLDVYYHFGGVSKFEGRRPWFIKPSLNYLRDETSRFIDEYSFMGMRVGRDLNFSPKSGMRLDAGVLLEIYNDRTWKTTPGAWMFDFSLPVIPGLGVGFFYRL